MTKYYFLATSLPPLRIGHRPDISAEELKTLLRENLTNHDMSKVNDLRWFYDLNNIRAFWIGEPLDEWGNLDRNELEEALLTREGNLPSYVFDFLQEYENKDDRLHNFSKLFFQFFDDLIKKGRGFVHDYALFERNLRLVLTAYRSRELKRNLAKELQFEKPDEDIVVQLMAQKDAKTFEPPLGFEDLLPILEEYHKEPYKLQKALLEYRYRKLEENLGFDVFGIDYILIYILNFIAADKWMQFDKAQGMEIVDTLVEEVS